MYQVNIKNVEKDLSWSAQFESKELAQEWLDKQIGKPNRLPQRKVIVDEVEVEMPSEFTSEILDISEMVALSKAKLEAKQYLASSDWYVIRFMDSGVEIPSDVKQKREEARKLL